MPQLLVCFGFQLSAFVLRPSGSSPWHAHARTCTHTHTHGAERFCPVLIDSTLQVDGVTLAGALQGSEFNYQAREVV